MKTSSEVARFITSRIVATDQKQKDIARKAGFDKPNIITMIKQGSTKLPLAKLVAMAKALETDPVQLLRMCMDEYHPEIWETIAPFMESMITQDECKLLTALRDTVGGPFISAQNEESKIHFENLMY